MKINIIFGAVYQNIIGQKNTTLIFETDQITVNDILSKILEQYDGKLGRIHLTADFLHGALVVLDNKLVKTDTIITKDETLKILPPIMGG